MTARATYTGPVFDERITASIEGVGKKCWRLVEPESGMRWMPFWVPDDGPALVLPWCALPGSQHQFLTCPAFEVLNYGARGSAKSAGLLMDFAQEVGKGYGPAWNGIYVQKRYKAFEAAVPKIEELIGSFFPTARWHRAHGNHFAEWPTGEVLYFRAVDTIGDYRDILKGRGVAWLGFDELTHWSDPDTYVAAITTLRTTSPRVPRRVRAATNPGPRDHWVARRFRIPELDGKIWGEPGRQRCAIKSVISENLPLLDGSPDYIEQLVDSSLTAAEMASNVLGLWSIGSAGLFSELWSDDVHAVPPVNPDALPRSWRISRCYDHGSSAPFSVLWLAESDGSPVVFTDGTRRRTVRGDVFVVGEWYGCRDGRANQGLRLAVPEIARGILARERHLGIAGRVNPGPADSAIFSPDYDRGSDSLADEFERCGVAFCRSTKGSRAAGHDMIRARMANAYKDRDGLRERPGLFISRACPWALRLIPGAPRDEANPDDCPKGYPDHAIAALRYGLADAGCSISQRGF